MADAATKTLQDQFRSFAVNLNWIKNEAKDIYSAYFATDASTKISALASNTDGASLASKLTKLQYVNCITFINEINDFFENGIVAQGDYLSTIDNGIYGNAAVPAELSDATEALADRIKSLMQNCLSNFITAKDILAIYGNSGLSVMVANSDPDQNCWGSTMNVDQLTTGITLVEQFKKMINNEVVTSASYADSVAIWLQL